MERVLEELVRQRASGRSEYCQIPQEFDELTLASRQALIDEGVFPPPT